ncbi:alpha/beta fold hydrolase [Methanobacterium sp. ACI-7]|uniref:alpha/beta fold hydrolase n=1 Tax=unclassified Methanobacterium TaxID=2627676 RepID=UPI0039C123F0
MPYINVGKENSGDIDIYYEDHGSGKPIVLIHGWPLSGDSWEKQVLALLDAGYRVITYDRRGFGKSSKPTSGYDYDTMAEDMNKLIKELNLEDVTLVGFSMGGGEVARYLGTHGSKNVNKVIFISAVTPYLLKTSDNEDGVDEDVFEEIMQNIVADRLAFLSNFFSDFYNVDVLKGERVSDGILKHSWNIASVASPIGTVDCVKAWLTDFREDLKSIDIPTLIIHGDEDRTVPFPNSGKRMPEFVKEGKLVVINGGPHNIAWTHAEDVNRELLDFLSEKSI